MTLFERLVVKQAAAESNSRSEKLEVLSLHACNVALQEGSRRGRSNLQGSSSGEKTFNWAGWLKELNSEGQKQENDANMAPDVS